MLDAQLFAVHIIDNYFEDIIDFFTTGMALDGYTSQQMKELVVCLVDFSVIEGHLYKIGKNKILRQYVPDFERNCILVEGHGGVVGGHYAGKVTA